MKEKNMFESEGIVSQEVSLDVGTGIINYFRATTLTWKKMCSEWIDNSFGAGARRVTIRKEGKILWVIDPGDGCDDLITMESLSRSAKKVGNKASMFGIGGVMSQIHATGAGMVSVESITDLKTSYIKIDWGRCLREDRLVTNEFREGATMKGDRTGTTIRMEPCKRIREVDKLARDLGYSYSGMLRSGHSITLDIDGNVIKVKPYAPPSFSERVNFEFNMDGHVITGFCGLVRPKQANPYPGWSIHWGYRFLGQFDDPAGEKEINRLYGEVNLPESWTNISVTKDGFNVDADGLWKEVAEHCREIIDAADAESQDIELTTTSKAAEDIISQALGDKKGIKGRRPGKGEEKGTVKSNGKGGPHENFATSQPGEKAEGDAVKHPREPDRVTISWDATMEIVYRIRMTSRGGRVCHLTLNPSIPEVAAYRNDPPKLATYCLLLVAREIVDGPDGPNFQKAFPSFSEAEFEEVYRTLLTRIAKSKERSEEG